MRLKNKPTRFWKTLKGSGMGLGVSGELADLTLYASIERGIVDNLELLRQHFIHLHVRFKDDILIIFGGARVSRVNIFF